MSSCSFINYTLTTVTYTLSLHDALPIYRSDHGFLDLGPAALGPGQHHRASERRRKRRDLHRRAGGFPAEVIRQEDRKSTRLNSSHVEISYAVFCLKKKKIKYYWRMLELY